LIEIINKPLLLHLFGYLYYWQMGFNSVFKGLRKEELQRTINETFNALMLHLSYAPWKEYPGCWNNASNTSQGIFMPAIQLC
jgi:hypothetical protein